jgi:proline iminopeptidase
MLRRDLLRWGAGAAALQTLTRAAAASDSLAAAVEAQTPKGAARDTVKTAGERMIPIDGGKHRVWTRRVGTSPIKVLTLHGGPGFSHLQFNCFEDFLPQAGIEFYYYDQLGCLFSDNPDDPSLWTIERYTDEVEQVRSALGLTNFYLYGQSWGGMLCYEYALKYPQHLKGLIISNMVASVPAYEKYVARFHDELSAADRAVVDRHEAAGDYNAPEYQQVVMDKIYKKHVCRHAEWPPAIELAFRFMNEKIYNYMQGPNEFVITGTFKNWDRTADLHRIKTKTLVMGARYDEMDPDEMRRIARAMPNARAVISERGSHLCEWDDQQWYFRELIRFLKET